MSLQGRYLCKFPVLYIIIINRLVACAHRMALVVLHGDQTASAESCTHPAKRDHRFSPPIAERQRLPNVRINPHERDMGYLLWVLYAVVDGKEVRRGVTLTLIMQLCLVARAFKLLAII